MKCPTCGQRSITGERNVNAKLSDNMVRMIRQLREDGLLQREIAEQLLIKPSTVSKVLSGKTWSHVK